MRWLFNTLSPAGTNARLSVLIFHRVRPARDPLFPGEPDAMRFETEMRWIKSWFNVLPLPEAVQRLRDGALPARAASITFDDGYADNFTVAMPVLQRLGLSATFFIATGFLDGGMMWNDTVIEAVRAAREPLLDLVPLRLGLHSVATIESRRASINQLLGMLKYREPAERQQLADALAGVVGLSGVRDLMLTAEQVRRMAQSGMTIGAHTVSHPILSRVTVEEARSEMAQSKKRLESIVGREVSLFAYPNGKPQVDYSAVHVDVAREVGFVAAVSTGWGAAKKDCDLFQIPRFTPWDFTKLGYALRLANNVRHAGDIAR